MKAECEEERYLVKLTFGASAGVLKGSYSYYLTPSMVHHDNFYWSDDDREYFERYSYKTRKGAENGLTFIKIRNNFDYDNKEAVRELNSAHTHKEKEEILKKHQRYDKDDCIYEVIPLAQMYEECQNMHVENVM